MNSDAIAEVRIDEQKRLHVKPVSAVFPFVYREGVDVHWDAESRSLHSSIPREWTYAHWFQHILATAKAHGCELRLTDSTRWTNFEPSEQAKLLWVARSG